MALKNLFGRAMMKAPAACGSACGAGDKNIPDENTEEKPAACGSACGAGDKLPAACGSACGAGDKK